MSTAFTDSGSDNPFERPDADYLVLVNAAGQHSLWPAAIAVPGGWDTTFGPGPRAACLDHVEANWTDLRPTSLT
ncbi:MbtH family protein [Actinokineospora globicatena]|uniref:MbtH protein n=1 Tax=Actinokineospora globicatena TaxID=103729 RepID=A0A9W6QKM0_9PSEU|nr:MbtH family protein [Actinokineospora globicatena]MCP2303547.1 MbtH protein [Actinokineospora globicatena]GLW79316.1 MbtH protein [Actinokineospora globicatena]GLW86274.1 MbtH protein [Actinokineospora globicatena]GLW89938.1 MbtH protein [Actinokineospora globicatena]